MARPDPQAPIKAAPGALAASSHDRAPIDLRARIATLAQRTKRSPVETIAYLRLLYELQDMPRFQAETRALAARIAAGRIRALPPRAAEIMLRLAEFAVLPADEVGALLAALRDGPLGGPVSAEAVAAATLRLRTRRALAARYEGAFTLISLGLHCLPWLVPNRWGLRSPGEAARPLTPFALAKHRYGPLLDDLSGDFAAYASPETLMSVPTPSRVTIAARRDRGVAWNHHKGEFWSHKGFAELLRALGEGLAAFRESAAGPHPVFLMGDVPFRYPEQPIERLDDLHAALDRLSGGRHHLLLASQRATRHGRVALPVDARTTFLHVPYPDPGYSWPAEATSNSPAGLRYERGYIGLIYRALLDWGLLRGRERGA